MVCYVLAEEDQQARYSESTYLGLHELRHIFEYESL